MTPISPASPTCFSDLPVIGFALMLLEQRGDQLWPVAEIRAFQAVQRVPQIHEASHGGTIEDSERSGNLETTIQRNSSALAFVDQDEVGFKR